MGNGEENDQDNGKLIKCKITVLRDCAYIKL